jgi:CRP/FNR family cyclic AMP-dependent transcriptional regulator
MSVRPGGLVIADALAEIVGSSSRALPGASVAVLREVPLFAGLSGRHLRKVAKLAMLARYRAGVAIVREGARGHDFYVILEGRAGVSRGGVPAATLAAGDHFGEMALLDRRPRSATVTTETATTALRIPASAFQKLLRSEPTIALALLETLSLRVRDLESRSASIDQSG